jgi:hypothetical protein
MGTKKKKKKTSAINRILGCKLDLSGLRKCSVANFFERGDEPSESVKSCEFFGLLLASQGVLDSMELVS